MGSMSDACVGLAGTLLADIHRGTYNLQRRVHFQMNQVQVAGPVPKPISLFLVVIITLNIIIQAQIAS